MKAFDYARAASLQEALGMLGRDGAVRPLAGGTDLLPLMKLGVSEPSRLIDVKRVADLGAEIRADAGGLTLGALTPLAAIEQDPVVQARFTALSQAAGLAASPQVRNLATIGGNLLQRPRCWYFRSPHVQCWLKGGADCPAREGQNQLHAIFPGQSPCVAVHPSDPAVALVALSASVQLSGRVVPIDEFFVEPTEGSRRETVVADDEILLSIHVPEGGRSIYLKAMDRRVWAFALVSVAVSVRLDGSRIVDARVVLGGVATTPYRSRPAEHILIGASIDATLPHRAAEAALAEAHPLAHNRYKLPLTRALVSRALNTLLAPDT